MIKKKLCIALGHSVQSMEGEPISWVYNYKGEYVSSSLTLIMTDSNKLNETVFVLDICIGFQRNDAEND